jgi:hypothetical protein
MYENLSVLGIDYLLSPNGQYELSTGNPWKLTEVRTGTEQPLGTTHALDRADYCVWSPDETSIACQGFEPEKFGGCRFSVMLIAPASGAAEKILFRSEQPVWENWGNLLVWQP